MKGDPTSENEVMIFFGRCSYFLGFNRIKGKQQPDCIAWNQGKKYRIEFEILSSDFKKHKHPNDYCDIIVCWRHNWKDCPLKVIELKPLVSYIENKRLLFIEDFLKSYMKQTRAVMELFDKFSGFSSLTFMEFMSHITNKEQYVIDWKKDKVREIKRELRELGAYTP